MKSTAVIFAVTLSGCMPLLGIKQVPFVHGSVDMNGGVPHSTKVSQTDLPALIKRITELGEKRSIVLVEKKCSDDRNCTLTYKRATDSKSKTVGSSPGAGRDGSGSGRSSTTTYNLSFSSRIFCDLAAAEDGTQIQMVGVPVINDTLSCPDVLARRNICAPQPFNVQGDQTPAQSFSAQWGVDISGALEAEIITGIFAELE